MDNKRPLSPTACTHEQLTKRLRVPSKAPFKIPHRGCIHCGSDQHNWVQCIAICNHCRQVHACKRCPSLTVEDYTPGEFQVRQFSTSAIIYRSQGHTTATCCPVDLTSPPALPAHSGIHVPTTGIGTHATRTPEAITATSVFENGSIVPSAHFNSDRVAMIMTTPALKGPKLKPFPALGPQRSGSNTLPLGPKRKIGTSWPVQPRDRQREQETWRALQSHIEAAVDDTGAFAKPFGGLGDRSSVNESVRLALNILRPIILGEVPQKQ